MDQIGGHVGLSFNKKDLLNYNEREKLLKSRMEMCVLC